MCEARFVQNSEESSLLNNFVLLQIWKVHRVIPVDWKRLRFKAVELTEIEQRTKEFDKESMRYLSYILYPLCIGGALYSLMFESHRRYTFINISVAV